MSLILKVPWSDSVQAGAGLDVSKPEKSSNRNRKHVHALVTYFFMYKEGLEVHEHVLLTVVVVRKSLTTALKAVLLENMNGYSPFLNK